MCASATFAFRILDVYPLVALFCCFRAFLFAIINQMLTSRVRQRDADSGRDVTNDAPSYRLVEGWSDPGTSIDPENPEAAFAFGGHGRR